LKIKNRILIDLPDIFQMNFANMEKSITSE